MWNSGAERRRGELTTFYNQVPLVSRCKPHPTSQQPLDGGRLAHPPQRMGCGHSMQGLQQGGRRLVGAESPACYNAAPGNPSPDRCHHSRAGKENSQDFTVHLPRHSLGDTAHELPTKACRAGRAASNALPIPTSEQQGQPVPGAGAGLGGRAPGEAGPSSRLELLLSRLYAVQSTRRRPPSLSRESHYSLCRMGFSRREGSKWIVPKMVHDPR